MNRLMVTGLLLGAISQAHAGETDLHVKVDWKTFLAQHDLVWDSMSTGYLDSPFVGNGLLGAMLAQEGDDCLKLSVGRTDVTEHVSGPGVAHYIGKSRLPIGSFQLKLPGPENPAPTIGTRDRVHTCVQARHSGGDYTTAWREVKLEDGTHRLKASFPLLRDAWRDVSDAARYAHPKLGRQDPRIPRRLQGVEGSRFSQSAGRGCIPR